MHYLSKIAKILLITDYVEIINKTSNETTNNMKHAVDFLEEVDNEMDDILDNIFSQH